MRGEASESGTEQVGEVRDGASRKKATDKERSSRTEEQNYGQRRSDQQAKETNDHNRREKKRMIEFEKSISMDVCNSE